MVQNSKSRSHDLYHEYLAMLGRILSPLTAKEAVAKDYAEYQMTGKTSPLMWHKINSTEGTSGLFIDLT